MAAAVGVAVELALSLTSHRREAWDSEYHWIFGVPAMILGRSSAVFSRVALRYALAMRPSWDN
jgi:hypothetical protein